MRSVWLVPGLGLVALLLVAPLPAADFATGEAALLANAPGEANVQAAADGDMRGTDLRADTKAAPEDESAPSPVPDFELDRYSGSWYVIASIPDRFYASCAREATVTYILEPDQRLRAESRCRNGEDGIQMSAGALRIKQPGSLPSRLQVRYAPAWLSWLPQTWSDLWIIELAPDYRYAVEATPDRRHVAILSRSPLLDKDTYDALLRRLRQQGFAVENLRRMPQQGGSATSAEEGVEPPAP